MASILFSVSFCTYPWVFLSTTLCVFVINITSDLFHVHSSSNSLYMCLRVCVYLCWYKGSRADGPSPTSNGFIHVTPSVHCFSLLHDQSSLSTIVLPSPPPLHMLSSTIMICCRSPAEERERKRERETEIKASL